jgi:alpha-ketoglutarate-dependent taurine dioxygenase
VAASLHGSPFDLEDEASYGRWRAWKLEHRAGDVQALIVDVADAAALSGTERAALLQRTGRNGAALYRLAHDPGDAAVPPVLAAQLGLTRLHANWLAGEDGISRVEVSREGESEQRRIEQRRADYIPYTERALGWHTDGYYHRDDERILGMVLHCVRPAASGGESAWLDPELAYIALRDESHSLVRALMHPQAMWIPAREAEDGEVARAAKGGPVFSLVGAGPKARLHVRYTARTRSIAWRDDPATAAAVQVLRSLTEDPEAARAIGVLRLTLGPGMGLIGHNVLHARSAFTDTSEAPQRSSPPESGAASRPSSRPTSRLLYRARYLDRITAPEEDAWRNG